MILQTLRTIRGLNRQLRTLFFATLLFRTGTMAFPFFAAYLLKQERLGGTQVGTVVSGFGIGALVADTLTGPLLNRLGARRVMLVGLLANGLILAAVPRLHGEPALLAATFAWGFSYEVFTPAAFSETVEHSTEDERKIAFSCNRLAINVGTGIGPALGGLVFVWRPGALFAINAAMCAVAAGYVAVSSRGLRRVQSVRHERRRVRLVSRTAAGESRFWSFFTVLVPMHLAYALPPTVLSVYVVHGRGLPAYWAGVLFFVNAACVVLFEVPLNRAMSGVGHVSGLAIGYGLAAVGFAAMAFASSPPALIAATLVWTGGEMIAFPTILNYISDLSDRDIAPRNMGLFSASMNIGLIVTPQLGTVLTAAHGPGAPWTAGGAIVAVALLVILLIQHNRYLWLPRTVPDEAPASSVTTSI